MATLREDPFFLEQGDQVTAIVRAVNLIGEGSFSEPNSVGSAIEDIPGQMSAPMRGPETSETQLHILWSEIDESLTGGATIDSYNVQWDQGSGEQEDLAG